MDPVLRRFCIYFALACLVLGIVMFGVLTLAALDRHRYPDAALFGLVLAFLIYSFHFLYSQSKGIWI
ncbi:MAG: hypothetical protein JO061_05905 [Acidobacteriaceae bacterium]|nr:hypothetical protein [Acidobacteriaceae bacterium]